MPSVTKNTELIDEKTKNHQKTHKNDKKIITKIIERKKKHKILKKVDKDFIKLYALC